MVIVVFVASCWEEKPVNHTTQVGAVWLDNRTLFFNCVSVAKISVDKGSGCARACALLGLVEAAIKWIL